MSNTKSFTELEEEREHALISHSERTVKSRLEIGPDGYKAELIQDISTPTPSTETFECSCGKQFTDWNNAKTHITNNRH
jgi:hypothetical protein